MVSATPSSAPFAMDVTEDDSCSKSNSAKKKVRDHVGH